MWMLIVEISQSMPDLFAKQPSVEGGPNVNNGSSQTSGAEPGNLLWQYMQSLSPETAARLSKPSSSEVLQVMERNIMGLLGGLPSENFDVTITTDREHLGQLLASAMMSGYALRSVE